MSVATSRKSSYSDSLTPTERAAPSEVVTWADRCYAALPLFFVGGTCIAAAVLLYLSGAQTAFGGSASVHLQPWILFVALGITGVGGGTVALFAEEAEPAPVEMPSLPAAASTAASAPAPAPSAPAWDESLLEPEAKPTRSVWRGPRDEELLEGAVSKPAPPDIVLRQLDELEASLRKKTGTPVASAARKPRPEDSS